MSKMLWFILLLLPSLVHGQNPQMELDTGMIDIGGQAILHLKLSLPSEEKVELGWPIVSPASESPWEVVDRSDLIQTLQDDSTKYEQEITLTSFEAGAHAIAPLEWKLGDNILRSNAVLLEVVDLPLEGEAKFNDMAEAAEVPLTFWDKVLLNMHLILIGLAVLMLVGILIGIGIWKKRKREASHSEKPDFVAIASLRIEDAYSNRKSEKATQKTFYAEVSLALRQFLEQQFEVQALEITTDELKAELKKSPVKKKQNLLQLLRNSDWSKFAKTQFTLAEEEQQKREAIAWLSKQKVPSDE